MEATAPLPSKDAPAVSIRIGTSVYLVDVNKIPYLKSYIRFQQSTGQDTAAVVTHDDIPFFEIINDGVTNGFRQFFRKMPTKLDDYHVLCETLEFLGVDVVSNYNWKRIMKDFREGKTEWEPEERRDIANKSVARDAAFRLLYLFLLGDFESEVKDRNTAYNATLFVVSHFSIFKSRTRKMVREAFEERFSVSCKQLNELNNWTSNNSVEGEEADETTPAEDSDYGYCSDWY